jgi:hypothetical protein
MGRWRGGRSRRRMKIQKRHGEEQEDEGWGVKVCAVTVTWGQTSKKVDR